jgi:DEAD/DEAH box helicase domain-containing protein
MRLIHATGAKDDPVALLKAAARDHIPIDPSKPGTWPTFTIPEPKDRPPIDTVLTEVVQQEWYMDQIVKRQTIDAKGGQIGTGMVVNPFCGIEVDFKGTLNSPLSNTVAQALQNSRRISTLYSHQTAAINAINMGKNVIVSTSTASGKSVIYQVSGYCFHEYCLLMFQKLAPTSAIS